MKKYNIKVNGNTYEVEVEEAKSEVNPTVSPVEKLAVTAPTSTEVPKTSKIEPTVPIDAGAQTITAPMPGTILDVRITKGDVVKAGDILVILEAMKMENEILAPIDGMIDTIQATKGESVNANDVLVTIK